jgi:hypothetical protein
LSGCGGGDEGFVWVRGVEAGRGGIEITGAAALKVGMGAGGWLGVTTENGWETDRDCTGNGFAFVDGNGFEALLSAPKGLVFDTPGNGFAVCTEVGNGLVEFTVEKPFCAKNGFAPVGADCRALLGPNGESPVACRGVEFARKGFAVVI